MVIFHSYVSLPEGNLQSILWSGFINQPLSHPLNPLVFLPNDIDYPSVITMFMLAMITPVMFPFMALGECHMIPTVHSSSKLLLQSCGQLEWIPIHHCCIIQSLLYHTLHATLPQFTIHLMIHPLFTQKTTILNQKMYPRGWSNHIYSHSTI